MSWIAAFVLLHLSEEETFWFMIQVLNEPHLLLKDLFKDGLPLLFVTLYQVERLLEKNCPLVYQHFEKHQIISQMYCAPFVLTLFTNRFPYECSERIWDIFLFEGWKHVIRTMVGFIKIHQDEIISADPLLVINKMYELAGKSNVDEINAASFAISLSGATMKSLEEEYRKKFPK